MAKAPVPTMPDLIKFRRETGAELVCSEDSLESWANKELSRFLKNTTMIYFQARIHALPQPEGWADVV